MKTETRFTQYALENFHISRTPIQSLNSEKLLKNYIEQFDPLHLFLTETVINNLIEPFKDNLIFYIQQGNLYPAFDIFNVCQEKCNQTLEWVLRRLDEPFDFYTQASFTPDRRTMPWPKDEDEKKVLWTHRLQYDILSEILGETALPQPLPDLINWQNPAFFNYHPYYYYYNDLYWVKIIQSEIYKPLANWNCIWNLIIDQNSQENTFFQQNLDHKKALMHYDQACKVIKDRYARLQENLKSFEASDIAEIFLTALAHQYDPHTVFFSADSMEEFSIAVRNSLVGIGAVLSNEDGYCIIRELIPGGPAAKSQAIKPGDTIVGIAQDQEPMIDIIGMKLRDTVKKIRGKKGTPVHLLIRPADSDLSSRKTITLIRDEVELTTSLASATLFTIPDNHKPIKIGVIYLPTFYGSDEDAHIKTSTTQDVSELIQKLKNAGAEALILDLRQNGGGLLPEAISLTGLFISTGPVLQVKDALNQISEHLDNDPTIAWTGPLTILTSRYSASASEILAGALKDQNRALIVGDPTTHGKGTVQAVLEIDRSYFSKLKKNKLGSIKITIQKWYRPSGESTQIKGVESDISLPSINPYLPIGESDLPQALPWDSIYSIPWIYDTQYVIDPSIKEKLISKSQERQKTSLEFLYLQEQVNWLQTRQNEKSFSLNLDQRLHDQKMHTDFQETLNKKFKKLPEFHVQSENIFLETALLAKKDLTVKTSKNTDDNLYDLTHDIHLKETLRIMKDWIELQKTDHTPPNLL